MKLKQQCRHLLTRPQEGLSTLLDRAKVGGWHKVPWPLQVYQLPRHFDTENPSKTIAKGKAKDLGLEDEAVRISPDYASGNTQPSCRRK
jgi:hypothetical protein